MWICIFVSILYIWKSVYLHRGTCTFVWKPPLLWVPDLVRFFAAIINSMTKSVLWRKGLNWLMNPHHTSSLKEVKNHERKLFTVLLYPTWSASLFVCLPSFLPSFLPPFFLSLPSFQLLSLCEFYIMYSIPTHLSIPLHICKPLPQRK